MGIREGKGVRREGTLVEGAIRMQGILGLGEGKDREKIWN